MDSQVLAGVIGVVLGAIVTVAGTWWVSVRLDRQRENRTLIGAIAVVSAELEENRVRIELLKGKVGDQDLGGRLTLEDWAKNKAALAGLELRDKSLWKDLVATYGKIYESKSYGEVPEALVLDELRTKLTEEQGRLRSEIRKLLTWPPSAP